MATVSQIPPPTEIGNAFLRLVEETATVAGLTHRQVIEAIQEKVSVDFTLEDGKLNITEEGLFELWCRKIAVRQCCDRLMAPHRAPNPRTPRVEPRPERKKKATLGGMLSSTDDIPGGGIIVALMIIGMIALVIWGSGRTPIQEPRKPMTQQDILIRDAVTLQRRIDAQERATQEKFDKEYKRQERDRR